METRFTMILLMAYCTIAPFITYRKLAKRLKYTALEISDEGITLTVPSQPTVKIGFTDINLVNKIDHGLMITGGPKGKKTMMITAKFEGFDEIVAKIDAVVPYTRVRSSLGILLKQAELPMAI